MFLLEKDEFHTWTCFSVDLTFAEFRAESKLHICLFKAFIWRWHCSWWVCCWSEGPPGGNGSAWSPASGWWQASSAWASSCSWWPSWVCAAPWSTTRSCSSSYPLARGVVAHVLTGVCVTKLNEKQTTRSSQDNTPLLSLGSEGGGGVCVAATQWNCFHVDLIWCWFPEHDPVHDGSVPGVRGAVRGVLCLFGPE